MTITESFAESEAKRVSVDIRRNSAKTKIQLLAHGVDDCASLFSSIGSFKEEHYAYDNGNWGVARDRLVPSELLLPGGIVSKIHIRPGSSIKLRADGHELVIEKDRQTLSTATSLKRPEFWNYTTASGVAPKRLAHFYGATCLNFNIYSGCHFYDVGQPCKFCSVQPTQDLHGGVDIKKQPQDLADVCRLAVLHDRVEWFLATGGSYLNGDVEFERHIAVLKMIQPHLPWNGRFRGNLALMPPKTIELTTELFELGVDHPSFNLEAWPRSAFETICPGKARYVGFNHIMAAYDYLVDLYGSGQLWCNFVAGLVPLKDQKDGFTAMAERGVIPGANVYHPDVGSPFADSIPSPSEDYIVELYQHAADLYRKFDYKPFFDASVLRNSLANEAYEGLL